MPKPYSKMLNSTLIEYGQYIGSDSRGSYTSKKTAWGSRPYPVMSNRNGSFEIGSSRVLREQLSPSGVVLSSFYGGWELMSIVTPCPWIDRAASLHPYIDSANGKLAKKVKDEFLNLPVFFAEANKTIDLFLDVAKRLSASYRCFRKGDVVGLARNLRIGTPNEVARSYLQYRYGFVPLMADLDGAVRAIANEVFLGLVHQASASVPFSNSRSGIQDGVSWRSISTGRTTARVWYKLRKDVNPNQLGLTNPAAVVWELVPLSFVADWFIPIGDYLASLDSFEGVDVLASFKIVRFRDFTIHDTAGFLYRTDNQYRASGYCTISRNGMDRIVGIDGANVCNVPLPPAFSVNLNEKRIADGFALLTLAFGSSGSSRAGIRR